MKEAGSSKLDSLAAKVGTSIALDLDGGDWTSDQNEPMQFRRQ